jgi:hypothetical protein
MPSTTKKSTKTTDKLPASKKSYGQGWGQAQKVDLTCPSGAVCEVRRPGVNGLIKAGILESMDSLTSLVSQEVIPKAEGKPTIDAKALMGDPQKFQDMLDMLDKVVLYCVTQPDLNPVPVVMIDETRTVEVLDPESNTYTGEQREELTGRQVPMLDDKGRPVPLPEEDREPGFYIDQVDMEDKTFIMGFVMGGQADIATFRAESAESLAGILSGEADGDQAV